jgi:hypothetical protein
MTTLPPISSNETATVPIEPPFVTGPDGDVVVTSCVAVPTVNVKALDDADVTAGLPCTAKLIEYVEVVSPFSANAENVATPLAAVAVVVLVAVNVAPATVATTTSVESVVTTLPLTSCRETLI